MYLRSGIVDRRGGGGCSSNSPRIHLTFRTVWQNKESEANAKHWNFQSPKKNRQPASRTKGYRVTKTLQVETAPRYTSTSRPTQELLERSCGNHCFPTRRSSTHNDLETPEVGWVTVRINHTRQRSDGGIWGEAVDRERVAPQQRRFKGPANTRKKLLDVSGNGSVPTSPSCL